jgi:hypothetical protein
VINSHQWYIVVRRNAVSLTGFSMADICERVMDPNTISYQCDDFRGQICTIEFDGQYLWRVAYSANVAPDGFKNIAYVLGGVHRDLVPWFDGTNGVHHVCRVMTDMCRELQGVYTD